MQCKTGGKSELAEVDMWDRYIGEKRADYDRLISIVWHIILISKGYMYVENSFR